MRNLQSPLNESRLEFEEIMNCFEAIESSRSLHMQSKHIFSHSFYSHSKHLKEIVEKFREKVKMIDNAPIFNGIYVQIGASFEKFIRTSTSSYLEEISKNFSKYEDLPPKIKNGNLYFTGKLFAQVHTPPSGRSIDFSEYSKRIGTCIDGEKSFQLNHDAFSMFLGNCTSEKLEKHFDKISIVNYWQKISKKTKIQTALNTKKFKETEKECTLKVDEYIKNRNAIAHRGENFKIINPSDIREYISFFKCLMEQTTDLLIEESEKHTKKPVK